MRSLITKTILSLFLISNISLNANAQSSNNAPVRIAVARITHGHVVWILNRKDKGDIQLVGIFEPDKELAERYAAKYGFKKELIYNDLNKMLDETKPEAVVAFGSIYQHMETVEACAPRHIHVMVEKPLAANLDHALKMEALAKKYKIQLLTNYETSWYPSVAKTWQLINDSNYAGNIRKVVFHDGHQGPKEINVNKEFFLWLTDPVQNGGGALVDFGCYGANMITYFLKGEKPVSVIGVTQHFKPDIYPEVEDEATIIIKYPTSQCIIQASWNWPFGRKDLEVYGDKGYIIALNNHTMRLRNSADAKDHELNVSSEDIPVYEDPFNYLAQVVRGKITIEKYGLYSLDNNIQVVRILEAAKESARTGKEVLFK